VGGTKSTVVQSPVTPAPSTAETSAQAYQSQLQYNPQLYQQYAQSYGQYLPQLAETEMRVQEQYAPRQQALQQQMYPQQTQLVEAMANQALTRMNNPYGYTAEEQSALDAIRQRQLEASTKGLRERSNLGGTLYGGRSANIEQQNTNELLQGFAAEDINRKLQANQMALSYATPVLQTQYPQVSNPQYPQFYQSVTPDASSLYNAYYQASQPQSFLRPGSNTNLGIFGQWGSN
jgi:hypothetical protein